MKNKKRAWLVSLVLAFGAIILTGCTANFCSVNDQSNMLYAYDNGVTRYVNKEIADEFKDDPLYTVEPLVVPGITFEEPVYKVISMEFNSGSINAAISTASSNGIETPGINYWAAIDQVLISDILLNYYKNPAGLYAQNAAQVNLGLYYYGDLKFNSENEKQVLWDNWDNYNALAVALVGIDNAATSDFISSYKSTMNAYIAQARSCITTKTGNYGYYGVNRKSEVTIEEKTYSDAWGKGFFEGLLVWPIAALIDVLTNSMTGLGTGVVGSQTNGWAQLLAIVIVTLIIRTIIFAISWKSTMSNAKMTELQPEIAKIQNKYPNANSSQSEKQRMSEEMQKLYKKNKINPFSSIIVLIFQFPIFICVWGAMQGNAWLSTGTFCNMSLSDSISNTLFSAANWANGAAETALVLFLLMAGAQVVSMLLPQWIQKRKKKDVAKLGKNPSAKSQDNKMKWVTYIMMIMIIVMGFTLASAMGVYWFIGAIFSIIQTLITTKVSSKRKKEKKY